MRFLVGRSVSYIMSFNFYVGASLWGFLSVILINLTTRYRQFIAADAAIGVVTTGSFALGVALVSHYKTFTRSFDAALFGNVLGVTDTDLVAIAAVTATAFLVIIIIYRQLLFTTFNSEVARLHGIRTSRIDALFSLILAGTIVVSIQVMGVTLIAAAIVVPPITARLLTNSFKQRCYAFSGDRRSSWLSRHVRQLLCGCILWCKHSPHYGYILLAGHAVLVP